MLESATGPAIEITETAEAPGHGTPRGWQSPVGFRPEHLRPAADKSSTGCSLSRTIRLPARRGTRARRAGSPGHCGAAAVRDSLHVRRLRESRSGLPRFTFHGFRYAELDDWPGELSRSGHRPPRSSTPTMRRSGLVELPPTNCSNKLHENTVWGMRGQLSTCPTDCPQRDERLGWTGDIQVFAPAATFLYASTGTLARVAPKMWPRSSRPWGSVPNFVPWIRLLILGRLRPPPGETRRSSSPGCCTSGPVIKQILTDQLPQHESVG